MLGVYPSRTGSWITPQELAGLVGRWTECENENHNTETWGCFLKQQQKKKPKIYLSQKIAKCTMKNIHLYHNIARNTEWTTPLTGAQNQGVQHISAPP